MINKKLLSFDRGALRYVELNVLFQWLGMLCNVVFVKAVAGLIGAAFAGSLTSALLWQQLVLCLATVPLRFACTMLASGMSDRASKNVKRTLRSSIYAKLARLGPNYTETAATSEVVMLASEGVEQIDTYFAKYLPQLFYSLLAPLTLFALLVGVHARSAIILLCCVPLIPMSIVAVQKFAKKLLANYWGEYTTLGDSFLENIQGLTTLKIYQADGWKHEQMNAQAERFRRITMKVDVYKRQVSQRVQFPVMLCHFLEASSALLYGTLVLPAARKPFQIVPLWVVSTTKSAVSAMWYWAK